MGAELHTAHLGSSVGAEKGRPLPDEKKLSTAAESQLCRAQPRQGLLGSGLLLIHYDNTVIVLSVFFRYLITTLKWESQRSALL